MILQAKQRKTGNQILSEAEIKSQDMITRAESIAANLRKEIDDARNDIRDRKQ